MQLKRGRAPLTVEREIDIDISREEVISILSQYIKRKMANSKVRFSDLSVVATKDEETGDMRLESITLLGTETLTVQYQDGSTTAKALPYNQPVSVEPVSQLPPPLQQLADAAAVQAADAVNEIREK